MIKLKAPKLTAEQRAALETSKTALQKQLPALVKVSKEIDGLMQRSEELQQELATLNASQNFEDEKAALRVAAIPAQVRALASKIASLEESFSDKSAELHAAKADAAANICNTCGVHFTEQLRDLVADALAPFFINKLQARLSVNTDAESALGRLMNPILTLDDSAQKSAQDCEMFLKIIDALLTGGSVDIFDAPKL